MTNWKENPIWNTWLPKLPQDPTRFLKRVTIHCCICICLRYVHPYSDYLLLCFNSCSVSLYGQLIFLRLPLAAAAPEIQANCQNVRKTFHKLCKEYSILYCLWNPLWYVCYYSDHLLLGSNSCRVLIFFNTLFIFCKNLFCKNMRLKNIPNLRTC